MNTLSEIRLNLYRDYTLAKVVQHCTTVLVSFGLTLASLMYFMSKMSYAEQLNFSGIVWLIGISILVIEMIFTISRAITKTDLGKVIALIMYGTIYGLITSRFIVIFEINYKEMAIAAGATCALMGTASWLVGRYGANKQVIRIAYNTLLASIAVSSILVAGIWLGVIPISSAILIDSIRIVFTMCAMLVFAGIYTNMAYKINPTSKEEADDLAFQIGLRIAIIAIDIFEYLLILYGRSKRK